MAINTNEPINTKKLCPNLALAAVPQTDKSGIYHGEAQSIWLRTGVLLDREQREELAGLGIILSQPQPAYSQGSTFVYTAELAPEANLKTFLALPAVLQVRVSARLEPLQEHSPARSALEELKISSGAPLRFIEYMNEAGVAQKAQRVLLSALEFTGYEADGVYNDSSQYKELLAGAVSASLMRASYHFKGSSRTTSTRTLAEALRADAISIRAELPDTTSLMLARDIEELSEQLAAIAD